MSRPSFQFYHGDWRSNAKLRRCTRVERGDWIDAMCLLADSDEFGILRWPLKDLAQAVGCPVGSLRALREKGVLKGADKGERCAAFIYVPRHGGKDGEPVILIPEQGGPVWYSSRMVRDEYVRSIRGEGTRFGDGTKGASKDEPKAPIGAASGTGATSSASTPSSLTASSPVSNLAKVKPVSAALRAADPPKGAETWDAYSQAYQDRYGVAPVRNAKVNSQIAALVDRLGAEEAPLVSEFYLSHNGARYMQACHSTDCLLSDSSKLRTEWARGRKVTRLEVKSAEQVDGVREQIERVGKVLEGGA